MRRRKLTREDVGLAALQIAGEESLDAVTFRAVAKRVGVSAQSLYPTYVSGTDDFSLAMVETLEADVAAALATAPWRQDVVRVLCELVVVNHLHGLGLDIEDLFDRLGITVETAP